MQFRRIQLQNYGPIESLDIEFPFDNDTPKPIVLVGANGSGKSIVLSHLVNALSQAQQVAYPASPEIPEGKVYKSRSNLYVRHGSSYSYARVEADADFVLEELRTHQAKSEEIEPPRDMSNPSAIALWKDMEAESIDAFKSNIKEPSLGVLPVASDIGKKVAENYRRSCALFLPPDRSESPAWINPSALDERAGDPSNTTMARTTRRTLVCESPLSTNRDWLYSVIFDKHSFELHTHTEPIRYGDQTRQVQIIDGYGGEASQLHEGALRVVREVTNRPDSAFTINHRNSRLVSLVEDRQLLVHNIFQLSSGEVALLNLGLSILRDFDWGDASFASMEDIAGTVIIDEADLHLHTRLQAEALPRLLKMFPKVQFIVTTHSPLFVLGLSRVYGPDGFAIYELPDGRAISPEEFSEFDHAFAVVEETQRFAHTLVEAAKNANRPLLVPEGTTDIAYLRQAAEILGRTAALDQFELVDGGGKDRMSKLWSVRKGLLADTNRIPIVLLFDCDVNPPEPASQRDGMLSRLVAPRCEQHPVQDGIENRFTKETLQKVVDEHTEWINRRAGGVDIENGVEVERPQQWTIANDHKSDVCHWLCEHADASDFEHFGEILDAIEDAARQHNESEA
ncbi:MAG: AAA family ATPase [Acidimicrobiaceae bacterium]|nr:AAA family ATPase [Acidimicrobiaceae bacterium]